MIYFELKFYYYLKLPVPFYTKGPKLAHTPLLFSSESILILSHYNQETIIHFEPGRNKKNNNNVKGVWYKRSEHPSSSTRGVRNGAALSCKLVIIAVIFHQCVWARPTLYKPVINAAVTHDSNPNSPSPGEY